MQKLIGLYIIILIYFFVIIMVNTINNLDELDKKKNPLKENKDYINSKLSSTLSYSAKPDDIEYEISEVDNDIEGEDFENDEDFDDNHSENVENDNSDTEEEKEQTSKSWMDAYLELLNFIREKNEKFIWNVEKLLVDWEKLTENQKSFIMDVLLVSIRWKKHPFINTTNFLINQCAYSKFSFNQIYSLSKLWFDNEQLEYFLDIINSIEYLPNEDIDYLIDNPELITSDIANKAEIISSINEDLNYEYDHWITFSIYELRDLKKVKFSDELKEKINLLFKLNSDTLTNYLEISDLAILDKVNLNKELLSKLNKLTKLGVSIYMHSLPYIEKLNVDKEFINKLKLFKKFNVALYSQDLQYINNLDLNNWTLENLEYYIKKIWKIKNGELDVYHMCFAANLSHEEIDKDLEICKKLWLGKEALTHIETIHNLPQEVIEFCNSNNLNGFSDIATVHAFYSLANKNSIQWYLERKEKFKQENKLLSDEKYIEYFWWKWKFNKDEIRQWGIGLCYMYTCFELFKKMNWFDTFIQSNFIEDEGWWKIRLPLNTWDWIKVHKEEIDKKYKVKYGDMWYTRNVCINSDSDFLWSKILEIAFIKRLIQIKDNNDFSWDWSVENPLDVDITWENLNDVEWWDTINSMQLLFWSENILKWEIYNSIVAYKGLKDVHAPSFLMNENKERIKTYKMRTEKLFDFHKTWLVAVDLWLDPRTGEEVRIKNVKVVDKFWNEIDNEELEDEDDIIISKTWKLSVDLYPRHAYSLEKCYIDNEWNKMVRVVNPWHTDIKFDISFKKAQELFKWNFWVIMIDELFKEE